MVPFTSSIAAGAYAQKYGEGSMSLLIMDREGWIEAYRFFQKEGLVHDIVADAGRVQLKDWNLID